MLILIDKVGLCGLVLDKDRRDHSEFMAWGVQVFKGGTNIWTENLGGGTKI